MNVRPIERSLETLCFRLAWSKGVVLLPLETPCSARSAVTLSNGSDLSPARCSAARSCCRLTELRCLSLRSFGFFLLFLYLCEVPRHGRSLFTLLPSSNSRILRASEGIVSRIPTLFNARALKSVLPPTKRKCEMAFGANRRYFYYHRAGCSCRPLKSSVSGSYLSQLV